MEGREKEAGIFSEPVFCACRGLLHRNVSACACSDGDGGGVQRVWTVLPALSLSPPLLLSLAVPAWLGALQRARWPWLSSPRCVPWALRQTASTGVTACVGASTRPWEQCVPDWKQGIFSLESLGGGGKAVVGSRDGGAVL